MNSTNTAIQKVARSIAKHSLLKKGEPVLVAVSGGADSVFLLHSLYSLRSTLGVRLHVAHFNHRLRKNSATDQKFVQQLAAGLKLPCSCASAGSGNFLTIKSDEETARKIRFAFLIKTAQQHNIRTIALGHTLDDQAETVLMRIIRGSGLSGMQAILPKRTIQGRIFIRPMLETTRTEIEKLLAKHKIRYRTDPSNKSLRYFRNQVRKELIPFLEKKYNPRVKEILAGLAETVSLDYDYLKNEGEQALTHAARFMHGKSSIRIEQTRLRKMHPGLRRILIRLAIEKLKGNTNRLTLRHMYEIEDLLVHRPAKAIVNLPGGILVVKSQKFLTISARNA